ncbi:MAG: phytoene/squalene synthase family protein [Gemmatimonadota bacterium]|nr:phytoene/squalene synthase family protein [Gemmatimonadota bacterium]
MKLGMRNAPQAQALFPFAPGVAAPPGPAGWDAYLSKHGRSFWMAAQLIPQPHREQLAGVYAFCRYTDDLVDHATCERGDLLRVLDRWEALSREAYRGVKTGVELLDVVIGQMALQEVPFAYVEGMMRAMRADVLGERFETLKQLEGYCHDVASVVGLWLTELFGVRDPWALERAGRLGVAMQLTNIARDVGEDWERGRMYLPQTMLDAHGVTDGMIGALRQGDAAIPSSYANLLEELMTVAERDYAYAQEALGSLPPFFRSSVAVASNVYRGIHDAIRANGYDSIRRRAVVSDRAKLALARAAWGDTGAVSPASH